MNHKKPAVFLDRDGVLNQIIWRKGKPSSPHQMSEFMIMPDAQNTLRQLKHLGYMRIVITNQPDYRRGLISKEAIESMHAYLMAHLEINAIYTCLHDNQDHCLCRKPKPGAILQAAIENEIDLCQSYMIGDRAVDIQAGQKAGCKTIWLDNGYDQTDAQHRITQLREAVNIISRKTI